MATTNEIRKALALAAAAYPNTKYPKQTVELWCRLLVDLPDGSVEAAVLDYLAASHQFFPAPGVIRQRAISLSNREELTPPEAWGEVRQAMSRVGFYGDPEFSGPAVERAVASVGGWKHLCSSENLVADRARFLEAYEAFARREREDRWRLESVKKLSGEARKKLEAGKDSR